MYLLDLTSSLENESNWLDEFLDGLEHSRKLPVRIYQMEFDYKTHQTERARSYVLMTVSKDAWLRLGALNSRCHTNLVEMLEVAFSRDGADGQLLLHIEKDTDALLVTRTADRTGDRVRFFFTPAR